MAAKRCISEQHKAIKIQVYDILENKQPHEVDTFIEAITAMNACSDEGMREVARTAKNLKQLNTKG